MKKLLFLSFMFILANGLFAQANAIDKYFSEYLEDEQFSVVYISPRMFQLFDQLTAESLELTDEQGQALADMAEDLRGLRILSTDTLGYAHYMAAKKTFDTSTYELLMTVRDKNKSNLEFFILDEGDKIKELLLLSGSKSGDFLLMSFVGNIQLNKVTRLAKTFEDK